MKRWIRLLLALALAGLLAGCGQSAAGQNFGRAVEGWQPDSGESEPVAMVPLDSPDFTRDLGFVLTGYPNDAALYPHKYFVLEGWYAQVEFLTAEELNLVVRIAKTGEMYLISTYGKKSFDEDSTRQLDGVEVRTRASENGDRYISWERGGFQFILHTEEKLGAPTQDELDRLVSGLAAEES